MSEEDVSDLIDDPEELAEEVVSTEETDPEETGEKEDAGTPPVEDTDFANEIAGLKKGMSAERGKRQTIEQQLQSQNAELERYRQQHATQQQQQQNDQFLDPDAMNYVNQQLQTQAQQMQEMRNQDFAAFQEMQVANSIRQSEQIARMQHDDYDEMEKAFLSEAENNQMLYQEMSKHPHPAQYAYDYGKKLRFMETIGDPEAYEKGIEEKVLAKMRAEQPEVPALQNSGTPPLPKSLVKTPSSGGRSATAQYNGPTPFDDIFE